MLPFAERLRLRARIVAGVRRFFDERGFVEVDTPVAARTVAPEPHLEAPAVDIETLGGKVRRYLQTSPELAMKRLLAAGLERIYQIAPAFRDGDDTRLHRPEFRIVEWYRRGEGTDALMRDCEELLGDVAATAGDAGAFAYGGGRVAVARPFRQVSVDAAFAAHAGFTVLDVQDREELAARAAAAGFHVGEGDDWDDVFHRAFVGRVEPALVADGQPLFLTDYPAPLAALARLSPRDPRAADRFELYAGGLELANGFGELVDEGEQRRRFERDAARRRAAGRHDYPPDERFFAALRELPPSAGIALGLDRLLMLALDASDIDEVAAIPWHES